MISMIYYKTHCLYQPIKPFVPDNCNTHNKNDNLENKILMSENIRQKRLSILEYFDAHICHQVIF